MCPRSDVIHVLGRPQPLSAVSRHWSVLAMAGNLDHERDEARSGSQNDREMEPPGLPNNPPRFDVSPPLASDSLTNSSVVVGAVGASWLDG
jgi:hypothetical protein